MSASLVGSEMCIRDSLIGKEPRRGQGATEVGGGRLNGFLAEEAALPGCCLLYTSDAADDM
eukprot:5246647-Alexandrium_andersonii.AAC.1